MDNVSNVIKKTLELCQERLRNNVLFIESNESLCKSKDFIKAGLPIKKYFNVCEMKSWELQKLPSVPGTYVFEGMEKLSESVAKDVYGWALHGKRNGVRVVFVSTNYSPALLLHADNIKG